MFTDSKNVPSKKFISARITNPPKTTPEMVKYESLKNQNKKTSSEKRTKNTIK